MAATITQGVTTISPTLVLSYESTRTSTNRVRPLLGGGIAVSLGEAGPRTGTLELFFLTEAAAEQAEQLHMLAGVFALADPDRPTIAMSYVVADAGAISRTLDPETRERWIVTVDYQEIEL